MSRPLRGERYAEGADPTIVALIEKLRDCRNFEIVREAYERFVPEMSPAEQALLACNDRFFLLVVLCNRKDMAHPWLFQRCREVEAEPDGYLDLWARYHGKSSIITFAGSIQEVLINPEIRIAIFSFTKEAAEGFVAQIKEELESNEKLIALFPDVLWRDAKERKQARSWSEKGITLKRKGNPREATVEGHGLIDALPTGSHFDLLVYDDVITEHAVTNPDQVKKATERMESSFSLGVARGTRKRMIGTRYHFGDTYAHILEHDIAKARVYTATDTGTLNGNPVFLSLPEWARVKREQRSQVAAQFLQNPLAGEENTFTTRWLRSYWVRPRLCNVYITIDPSLGRGKTSDRTAIAVVGVDGSARDRLRKYLLDGFCHRMPLSERYERVRDLHKRWSKMPGVQMVKVGLERYGMQADWEYAQERMRIENYWFQIDELNWVGERPGGQSKRARVGRLEPHFRHGSFFVPARVWHPVLGNDENHARWYIEEGADEIKYAPCPGLQKQEREAKATNEHWRLMEPIMRRDEDGNIYDLTRVFFEEYALFPFSPRDDFVDALSRLIDMDPQAPVVFEQLAPEDYPDS